MPFDAKTYRFDVRHPLPLLASVIDAVETANEAGLEKITRLVCYDIAQHEDPIRLDAKQAEEFVDRMRRLISARYIQARLME